MSSDEKITDALKTSGLFDGMSEQDIHGIVEALRPRYKVVLDGETVCETGDPADCMWVVTEGRVVVSHVAGGQPNTMTIREPYSIIGEVGLILPDRRRSARMTAMGRTTLLEIPRACIEEIADPVLATAIWRTLARVAAAKLAQSVDARSAQAAYANDTERLLRRFSNSYALSGTRTEIKDAYRAEQAVVWFSDLVGFSEIAEKVSVEETANLVKKAMTEQSAVIEGAGGHIDKFMGDGLMAYWIVDGTGDEEVGREVSRAFQAAEAAVAAITSTATPIEGAKLGLRIGLNFGEARSGNFGSETRTAFTLIGNAVNLAARLEQVRAGVNGEQLGSIRVGEAFYRHLAPESREKLSEPVPFQEKKTKAVLHTNLVPTPNTEA